MAAGLALVPNLQLKYTMIIYLSTCGVDFKGGEFSFINQKISPKKYDVIFFDSREVHTVDMVYPTKKGQGRQKILVKFYSK
jgi:hypothetical protein